MAFPLHWLSVTIEQIIENRLTVSAVPHPSPVPVTCSRLAVPPPADARIPFDAAPYLSEFRAVLSLWHKRICYVPASRRSIPSSGVLASIAVSFSDVRTQSIPLFRGNRFFVAGCGMIAAPSKSQLTKCCSALFKGNAFEKEWLNSFPERGLEALSALAAGSL